MAVVDSRIDACGGMYVYVLDMYLSSITVADTDSLMNWADGVWNLETLLPT